MDYSRARAGRAFWPWWTAVAATHLGDSCARFTLPLLALHLTSLPSAVAGVTLALTLAHLLFALHAGVLVDRVDRRRLLLLMNTVRIATLVGLAGFVAAGVAGLVTVYAAALALGACETLFDTGAGSLTPSLVARDRLDWANTRLAGAESVMGDFVGPAVGGVLVTIGLPLALASSAGVYLAASGALLLLSGAFRPVRPPGPLSLGAEIAEGVRFLWGSTVLRTLTCMVAVMAGCWGAWSAVLVLYVVAPGPVGLTEFEYGVLLTALAIGGLAGAALVGPTLRRVPRRAVLALDVVCTSLMLVVPALTPNPWAIGAATVAGGFGSAMWNVVVRSTRQSLVPDALLGRVGGASRLVAWGTLPLGAAAGGIVASIWDVRAVFAGGAALTILVAFPLLRAITDESLASPAGTRRPGMARAVAR